MSTLFGQLVTALRCLPSVGPKTAQRMALHLLERNRDGAQRLADVLAQALERMGHCRLCRNLTEDDVCAICSDERRDIQTLCVVETPADVLALEQAVGYRGRYFVLLGRLSPLDGLGPTQLGLDLLEERLATGEVKELILATNPTVEGEATAYYLAELAQQSGVALTRIAHGVPLGGELEYTDQSTLAHAFSGRRQFRL